MLEVKTRCDIPSDILSGLLQRTTFNFIPFITIFILINIKKTGGKVGNYLIFSYIVYIN